MSHSSRPTAVFPITTRRLEVLRTTDVTPGMRRVTLGGEQLRRFTAPNGIEVADFRSDGFDDEFKLFFTHPDRDEPLVPVQADGVLSWPRGPHLVYRTYTVRRFEAAAGEVDVDFVRHGSGAATSWAYGCRPGDTLHVAGPKLSRGHPEGADWVLLAGDETALPAIGRWLEEMAPGTRAKVFIEVAAPSHRQELITRADAEITWLVRGDAQAGTSTLLFDAIRGMDWPPGAVFVWAAGEALTLTPIRRWLRAEKGLPKRHLDIIGYWRRTGPGAIGAGEAAPDSGGEGQDSAERLHELTELLPPVAIRVAVTLGVPDALAGGSLPSPLLADKLGCDRDALDRLLRYLARIDIVTVGPAGWALSRIGQELLAEEIASSLDLRGARAAAEWGLLGLFDAVRTGTSPYRRIQGASYAETIGADTRLQSESVQQSIEEAAWLTPAFASEPVFAECLSIVVFGAAAAESARAVTAAHADLRATVVATAAQAAAAREAVGEHDRIRYVPAGELDDPTTSFDAALIVESLGSLAERDALAVLGQAARAVPPGRPMIVIERPLDHATANEHTYEEDLLRLVTTGGAVRPPDALVGLLEQAGLRIAERRNIGWGVALFHAQLSR